MSTKIKMVESDWEREQLFKLRHEIFVEDEKIFDPLPENLLYDIFDTVPCTGNFIAVKDGGVVGGLRITRQSGFGLPCDFLFDYSPFLDPNDRPVSCGMLCVEKESRESLKLVWNMFMMGFFWASTQGATHLLAPVNPVMQRGMTNIGCRNVGPAFQYRHFTVVPMLLKMTDINDRFIRFAKGQKINNYGERFERVFYSKGEQIMDANDLGREAYLIVNGKVCLTLGDCLTDKDKRLSILGPGEIFGELSLLTSKPSKINAFAVSHVDIVVLRQDSFLATLRAHPERAEDMMQQLGNRLHQTLTKLRLVTRGEK